ncbi:4-carboxymuconolactone decarboxylase [Rhodococcus sp. WWJCD1]|uniref:carboxymuconolactone decarboxylase family protein n=1 Tax=unclassified Rhodococcus (in: high G+C Gram-positive bacteria) TaxID=192944 RepID=UPI000B9BE680|nr:MULTISPECIES: carboxymuconolactone decarboxylase family protein [unclassified Rhodococcus (in: high G+C Gram-positive bacteria)]OZC44459.1 4-carboxymuconolactone decarboxylase [Rhodococcus sp. WWJCD1]OZE74242.1 4-carboxymuconolactone decarboxylase [Rhodococcus sp. 15-649-2-2]
MIDDEFTTDDKGPRFRDGLAVRQDVMGEEFVERAFADAEHTDSAALQAFVTDTVWGGVWTRPGLDHRSRSLLNLGILIALRAHEELAGHVRGALRNGLTRTEITESVIHTAGYCGAPAALAAMRVVQRVLDAELGPLDTAGKSNNR